LSITTVARAVNQRSGVRESARQRVEEAIAIFDEYIATPTQIKKVALIIAAGSSFIGLAKSAKERFDLHILPKLSCFWRFFPRLSDHIIH